MAMFRFELLIVLAPLLQLTARPDLQRRQPVPGFADLFAQCSVPAEYV